MKKNKLFIFLLTGVIIVTILAFLTLEPKKFAMTLNQDAVYTIIKNPESCLLFVLNGADGKRYWLSGLSTKEVRNYVDQPAKIKGSIVRIDKLPMDKRVGMGITDDCIANPNGDSQIVIKIDEITPIYTQQPK